MAYTHASKSANSNKTSNNEFYINISEKDKVTIEQLKLFMKANTISFISDVLSMQATINAIETIYKKYTKSKADIYNPDELLIYSIYAGIFSRLIVTGIGFQKFNIAYEQYKTGDKTVNMNNFSNINYINVLFIYGGLIALSVANNIYESNKINIFE